MTLRWSPGYAAVDADFDSVSLLLHGDGTNGSTTIVDSSPSPKTVTAFGDAQISTAQSKFGGSSLGFDGSGDYLQLPSDSAFNLDADFTIEFWAWKSANGYYDGVIGTANGSTNFIELTSTRNNFRINFTGGMDSVVYSPYNPDDSTWHHYAISRSGSLVRLYIDGIQVKSGTTSSPFNVSGGFISRYWTSYYFNGYIDDLRITKGVARYTSNFTPPTAPFPDLSPTTRLTLP